MSVSNKGNAASEALWKIIRIVTTAPMLAIIAVCLLWGCRREVYSGTAQFIATLFLLGIIPLLAYPLQRFFPRFRDEGRKGQRILAMIFAVGGYVICCGMYLVTGASSCLWMLCLIYLLSGLVILLFNKVFHLKLSGHACGVTGPVVGLYYAGLKWIIPAGLGTLVLVAIASLKTKRHTLPQLIGGSLVPVCIYFVARITL